VIGAVHFTAVDTAGPFHLLHADISVPGAGKNLDSVPAAVLRAIRHQGSEVGIYRVFRIAGKWE